MFQRNIAPVSHFAEINGGNWNLAGKPPINPQAVSWHLLNQTAISPAGLAEQTFTAGHDGRDDHLFAHPFLIPCPHRSPVLVTKGERWFLDGRNTIVEIAQVRMTDSAARHFYQDLIRRQCG